MFRALQECNAESAPESAPEATSERRDAAGIAPAAFAIRMYGRGRSAEERNQAVEAPPIGAALFASGRCSA